MSEDLFSYSNTGEPKQLVTNFIDEVVTTVEWLTEEAEKIVPTTSAIIPATPIRPRTPTQLEMTDEEVNGKEEYGRALQQKKNDEKEKLWKSLMNVSLNLPVEDISSYDHCPESNTDNVLNDASLPVFHRDEVFVFLKRARAAYGRTALCLSGGAMAGLYHFGHVAGLLEEGVLPSIISGTSGGSVIGAVVCTRTDEELRRDFDPRVLCKHLTCFDRSWSERIRSFWQNGNLFDFDEWLEKIQWFSCGQTTFAEAYKKTGRVFCVTLSCTTKKAPPVLINHLTAPNVTIASAVIASAAVPGFIPPVKLQYSTYSSHRFPNCFSVNVSCSHTFIFMTV